MGKVKELEELLAKKREEKRCVVADYKAKAIMSREAAQILGDLNMEIIRLEKEIKRAKK